MKSEVENMFCDKCGAQLADTASFCNKCGNTVKRTEEYVKSPVQKIRIASNKEKWRDKTNKKKR